MVNKEEIWNKVFERIKNLTPEEIERINKTFQEEKEKWKQHETDNDFVIVLPEGWNEEEEK